MTELKRQQKKEWLDEGIRHLYQLQKESGKYAEKGDIRPTDKEIKSAIAILREFSGANAPRIALSVNGEIVFTWENTGDSFKARIDQCGDPRFYHNKTLVDLSLFRKYLTAVPA